MSFVTVSNYGLGYGSSKYGPYQGCQTSMFGSCESVGGYGNKNINYQTFTTLKPLTVYQKSMMMAKQSSDRYSRLSNQLLKSTTFTDQQIPKQYTGIL